jgi:elongin-A
MEDDRELWIDFIKRDVPQWDRFELPEESSCWYDIYRDLTDQVQREVDEDAQRLKIAVDKLNSKRASSGSIFITDRQQLPRPRPTVTQRYASHDRKMGGIKPTFSASYNVDGDKVWAIDKTPRVRPDRSRSEPKRNNLFTAKRNRALAIPTHRLKNEATQIKQVPQWLVDEHKQPPPIQKRPTAGVVPKTTPTSTAGRPSSATLSPQVPSSVRPLSNSAASPSPPPQPTAGPRPSPLLKHSAEEPPSIVEPGPQKVVESSKAKASSPDRASPPLAPALIRKRPAHSIFIQPKKKKV